MAAAKRIADEPAFVLHSYDWSESSLILEVFCRRQGRVALVAKGAKKPTSNFRPVLLPLQPLLLTYTLAGDGTADIHTLKGAEWVGGHVMPTGDALLSGLYLNELLLRLLARADAHTALFDAYAGVVRVLASEHGDALEPVLRSFELLLLREIGLLPSLDAQTMTLEPLKADARYTLVAEGRRQEEAAATAVDRGQTREGTGLRYIKARLEESFPGAWSLTGEPVAAGWRTTIEIAEGRAAAGVLA